MIEIGKEIKGKKNQKRRLNYKVPQWKRLKWQVNMKVFLKIGKQPGGNNVKKEVKGPAKWVYENERKLNLMLKGPIVNLGKLIWNNSMIYSCKITGFSRQIKNL